jgi:hypothetical protein
MEVPGRLSENTLLMTALAVLPPEAPGTCSLRDPAATERSYRMTRWWCPASVLLTVATALLAQEQAASQPAPSVEITVEVSSSPTRPWSFRPTPTLHEVQGSVAEAKPALTGYGGRTDKKTKASGFFRTERIGDRWWLIDALGGRFLSVGLCTVAADPPAGRSLIEKRFGSVQKWTAQTADLLRECGFNTLGCWSWWEDFRKLDRPFPYTTQWRFMTSFEESLGGRPFEQRPRTSPRSLIHLFDSRFEAFCDEHARQLAATRNDPWLLGHFSDNELPFQVNLLNEFLKLPEEHSAHQAANAWLQARGKKGSGDISREDQEAFREHVVDRYYRIVGRAIRKHDPNHLYIGTRFHGRALDKEAVFKACGPHVDVVSVNYYHAWTPDRAQMDRWVRWSGRPFLITEWYAKAMDSGLKNEAGAGWTVHTQEDRARFYQHFALGLLADPGCVGWHWFRYQDNGPQREGGTSNKGLVTLEFKPYLPLQKAMGELNRQVYALADHFDRERQKEARK